MVLYLMLLHLLLHGRNHFDVLQDVNVPKHYLLYPKTRAIFFNMLVVHPHHNAQILQNHVYGNAHRQQMELVPQIGFCKAREVARNYACHHRIFAKLPTKTLMVVEYVVLLTLQLFLKKR
jgi:hypothetical protein